MLQFVGESWTMLREAASDWLEDKAPQLGAALAFYSILSVAPLVMIAIAVAALVFGEDAARGALLGQVQGLVGEQGADAIQAMLSHAKEPAEGTIAAVIGVITLLFGASGVFGQLQEAMNTVWEVPPKTGGGIWSFLRGRFLSFAMVLGIGFLLLVSLLLSAMIAGAGSYLSGLAPDLEPLWHAANGVVTFVVVTALFAMIFKFLPDTQVAWRDVWVGALLTAALFTVGKMLIGLYLGKTGLSSAYGTAGSLVVLVVWIYYSAQILFFGAELTQVYARRHGSKIGSPQPAGAGEKRETQQSQWGASQGHGAPG
jgi:membrane protein